MKKTQRRGVTKSGIELAFITNTGRGGRHVEWCAPCGCAFHPDPSPHWHQCEEHSRSPVDAPDDPDIQTLGESVQHLGNAHHPLCDSCGEGCQEKECLKSKRDCGHHCNCSWVHDSCCWCGVEFGEDGAETEPVDPDAKLRPWEIIRHIEDVACGVLQVADDDTEGLRYIWEFIGKQKALRKSKP